MQLPAVRSPAVAGRFYPAKVERLKSDLARYLGLDLPPEKIAGALGCVVPHAGYMYSGHVAGAVFRKLPQRQVYVILCPNHTGRGAPLAIMSSGMWLTPLGSAPVNTDLAGLIQKSCRLLVEDSEAHEDEHSLEVQLPFLQTREGEFSFVPIAVGANGYAALEALGHGIAKALKQFDDRRLS